VNNQNSSGHAASRYNEQDIRAAEPMDLVVRIYEIACQSVNRARAALGSRDWAAKGKAVNQASRSIALLQATLDRDRGGEVASNLDRLYTYFQLGLSEAHLNNDDRKFGEIADHINQLLDAWRTASRQRQKDEGAPAGRNVAASRPPVAATGGR
jgi:flagellar protein FliS